MKILVLGAEGMLGHKMWQTLKRRYPHTEGTIFGRLGDPFYQKVELFRQGVFHEEVNVLDLPQLEKRLAAIRPDYLVNCIGIIKQRADAHEAIPSITINALLPHLLASWSRTWGGRVFHFSTDCVFSGRRGHYLESDISDAEDLYGKSKFLGEVKTENALTLRTSIIGRELSNFQSLLEWFLHQNGKTIRGFRQVYYTGVTTNHLAQRVGEIIANHPRLSGLYQLTSPVISKNDLLLQLRQAYRLNVEIIPDDQEKNDRSLVGDTFYQTTGYSQPSWAQLIQELVEDPTPYERWR